MDGEGEEGDAVEDGGGGTFNGADGRWKRMMAERNRRRAAATRLQIGG
jgi:hypothetical protein